MKHILTAVALSTTVVFSAPAWAQNIAIVNGKPVPSARLDALAQQVERSGRPVDEAMRAQLKEEVVAREVFMQEAEKRGLKNSKEYKSQMELASQTILIRELFADYQRKNPVTAAEVKAEYDKFATANAGQEFRSRHILVAEEAEAKAIIASIQGGQKFDDIAKAKSIDTGSGANGGDLDWATAASFVTEFSEAMVKLGKGEMTKAPVRSQFGWHIIRVDDIRAAQLPSLDELKAEIEQELMQQRMVKFQDDLRAKAKIQ